ncbi:MAG: phosphate ABC transporter permease subunit PstC, partial [Synechococcaceae cyanobacterium]
MSPSLQPMAAGSGTYPRRRRPLSERLVDQGFRQLTFVLAASVALILLAILITVSHGAEEAFRQFGLRFITTSDWNPVMETYGALTAVYGTLITSLLALLLAVPLG